MRSLKENPTSALAKIVPPQHARKLFRDADKLTLFRWMNIQRIMAKLTRHEHPNAPEMTHFRQRLYVSIHYLSTYVTLRC